MGNEPIISVIIPIYNTKAYLRKCISSVLMQTYENLEIILVDDGSTDGSDIICDEFAAADGRVRVIHQENAGQSAARNAGIELAKGEWVAFLDSDDWIEPEMYQSLFALYESHPDYEIIACKTRYHMIEEGAFPVEDSGNVLEMDIDHIVEGLRRRESVRFEIWNKLWKRSLIGEVRFKYGQISEEVYFDRILFMRAKKMLFLERSLHNYLISRSGNTNSSFKVARLCIFDELNEWIMELEGNGLQNAANSLRLIAAEFVITIYESAVAHEQSKEIQRKIVRNYKTYYSKMKFSKCFSLYKRIRIWLFAIHPSLFMLVQKLISALQGKQRKCN